MKFGKNLLSVVELSDPEWGYIKDSFSSAVLSSKDLHLICCRPFWMNYKMLKKKINDIVVEQGGAAKEIERSQVSTTFIAKSPAEVEFFRYYHSSFLFV